jgi:hypothetical protein
VAKKIESRERRGTIDSHYHSGSGAELAGVAVTRGHCAELHAAVRGETPERVPLTVGREGSKRDSSTPQADSFADERRKKASACSGRNDRW